jgi:hypothetical protein
VPHVRARSSCCSRHQARLNLLLAERRDGEALEAVAVLATRFAHIRNPFTSTWRAARATIRHRAGDLDELPLEQPSSRTQHRHGSGGATARLVEQCGLADPCRSLDHRDAAAAVDRSLDGGLEHVELAIAFERRHGRRSYPRRRRFQHRSPTDYCAPRLAASWSREAMPSLR